MGLSRRELSVLREIVGIYIRTGETVASRQVAGLSSVRLSSATLRNIMASLEERGLLSRPHPSAGCIPTDAGLRAYVDSFGHERILAPQTRSLLEQRLSIMQREPMEDLEWVAQLVADMTQEAGVAIRPIGEELILEVISLIPMERARVLGVVVTKEGTVSKRVAVLDEEWTAEQLLSIGNFMNHHLHGRVLETIEPCLESLEQALESRGDMAGRELAKQAAKVWHLLFTGRTGNEEVLVVGANNLLQAEDFAGVERMRSMLATLNDRAGIAREWRRIFDKGRTQVVIGQESTITSSGQLAMVATLFYCEGRRAGALGAVGPCRMDYLRIVPVVEYIGDKLTSLLDQSGVDCA
jgi:heat-inducible transcriptional repressor